MFHPTPGINTRVPGKPTPPCAGTQEPCHRRRRMTGGKIGEQLRTGLTSQVSTSSPCSQWHIVTLAESSVTQRGTGPRNWTTGWRVAVYKSKATQVKHSTAFPSKFCSVNHQLPFVHHSDSCGREDELSHLGTLVRSPPTWKISITSDRSVSPLGSISPTSSFCRPGWGRGPTACHPSTSRLRLPAGARALPRRHGSGSHGPNHLRFCQSMACDRMLPFLFEADSLASLMWDPGVLASSGATACSEAASSAFKGWVPAAGAPRHHILPPRRRCTSSPVGRPHPPARPRGPTSGHPVTLARGPPAASARRPGPGGRGHRDEARRVGQGARSMGKCAWVCTPWAGVSSHVPLRAREGPWDPLESSGFSVAPIQASPPHPGVSSTPSALGPARREMRFPGDTGSQHRRKHL